MWLTKMLLMTLSAIRRDRAAAAGVIMKEAGSTAGKHHAARLLSVVCIAIEDTYIKCTSHGKIESGLVHPDNYSHTAFEALP